MIYIFLAMGWLFAAAVFGVLLWKGSNEEKLVEQKNNAIKVWQRECVQWRELSRDKDAQIAHMAMEIERRTPKQGKGGKFVSKREEL